MIQQVKSGLPIFQPLALPGCLTSGRRRMVDLRGLEPLTPWLQTATSNLPNLAGAGVLQADLAVCGKSRKTEPPLDPRQ